MSTYAIGDIQGCYQPFKKLLKKIDFSPEVDHLWLAGDLINRGPETLKTLRKIVELDDQYGCIQAVLGNHDLHFIACAYGMKNPSPSDTLDELIAAPDRQALIDWLRRQPLVHTDNELDYTMVHAGIPPQWSIKQANKRAREVEAVLQSNRLEDFLAQMYGNEPNLWSKDLLGMERLRAITNSFTRMRFCQANGQLELKCKEGPEQAPTDVKPWFAHTERKTQKDRIVFGHWAALEGNNYGIDNIYPLDTGCVWGGELTAMRLDDGLLFSQHA